MLNNLKQISVETKYDPHAELYVLALHRVDFLC